MAGLVLSEQMEGPIHSKVEMNTSWPRILQIIEQDPSNLSMAVDSFQDGGRGLI